MRRCLKCKAKSALRYDVGIAAIELVAIAAGAIALGSVTSALWIATGKRNVMRLCKMVYEAATTREMEWFDTKMCAKDSVITTGACYDLERFFCSQDP